MTAATDMECLSDETLAAFVDGKLDESERAAVTEHLVSCGECRWHMIEARELSETEKKILDEKNERDKIVDDKPNKIVEDKPAKIDVKKENVSPFRKRKTRLLWIAGPAAAMLIVVAVPGPIQDMLFPRPGLPDVFEASASLKMRPTPGRLTGDSTYKALKPTFRDGEPKPTEYDSLALMQVQTELEKQKRPNLHALGVTYILLADRAKAVTTLEKALAQNPADRAAIEQDLAVALMQRGQKSDLERSLKISERLWKTAATAENLWNRAYALDFLGRDREAIAAWDEYLKLDSTSEWAQEATIRRDELQEMLKP